MANRIAVVGAQWGDEGKGAVICRYANRADVVVRCGGGDNSGHTTYDDAGTKRAVNIAPSGVIFPHITNVIASGCVVNLETLAGNINGLETNLLISDTAHLIFDWHKELDGAKETARGEKAIGTTKRGIGPAYADKANRVGIRAGLLKHPNRLEEAIMEAGRQKNEELKAHGLKGINPDEAYTRLKPLFEKFAPLVADTSLYLDKALKRGKKVLFEGAQATMLDIDHGTYPYCTSSSTVVGGLLSGAGAGVKAIEKVIGVTKAYTTRVGEGIFPTEGEAYENIKTRARENTKLTELEEYLLREGFASHPVYDSAAAKKMMIEGDEYGTTTGRPRRTGWLDLVVLKKAARINGLDFFALTKLDCLDGIRTVKAGIAYQNLTTGERVEEFPNDQEELRSFKPVYQRFPGWINTTGIKEYHNLPKEAQDYVEFIAQFTGVPLALIKNGPKQEESIELISPW